MDFDLLSLGDHLPDPYSGGYNESQSERYAMWIEMGVRGEKLGFSRVLFGEHHGSEYVCSSPQMLLAAIAAQTKEIRLGTAVSLLPNLDPVRVAEDFAALDVISGGRAEIGFGSGFTADAFELFGHDLADSDALVAENLDLIQRLWCETSISWSGRFRPPLRGFQLQPRTCSGQAIPVSRATAGSMATAVAAGRAGHQLMLLTAVGDFARVRHLADAYRESFVSAGRPHLKPSVAVVAYVHVQDDDVRAKSFWRPYIANYRAFTARLATRGVIKSVSAAYATASKQQNELDRPADFVGCPDAIIDKIAKAYDEVGGFDRLMCYFDVGGLSRRDTLAAMELFSNRVRPGVQSLGC